MVSDFILMNKKTTHDNKNGWFPLLLKAFITDHSLNGHRMVSRLY